MTAPSLAAPPAGRSRSVAPHHGDLDDPGGLQRLLIELHARSFARVGAFRLWRIRRAVAVVDAARDEIRGLAANALAERIESCRERLHLRGPTSPASLEALAIVREVAGRELGTTPYLEQLMSAQGLLWGYSVEMETGEGKTLSAAVAASVFGLAGQPTHVVTTNDYLAGRDAASMEPLFRALGLRVDAIREGMSPEARRHAYAAAITYASSKEVTFDYLRDRLALGSLSDVRRKITGLAEPGTEAGLVMRGLGACIVDEADSVLVDEARTPLILARREEHGTWTTPVLAEALRIAAALVPEAHFKLNQSAFDVRITEAGTAAIEARTADLDGPWRVPLLRHDLIHKALSALHLFRRDHHYVVREGKIELVSEHTGRIMADRTLTEGLHQLIEAKEGCGPSPINVVLGKTSFQRLFRRYRHLSGMSGTLTEVASELVSVYGLKVVKVPTRLPSGRRTLPRRLFATPEEKWAKVAKRVAELHAAGRPILVGTRSIEGSEAVGRCLESLGIEHVILNAKNPDQEAGIVAAAGQPGRVTVATGMAGRGTDIRPAAEVIAGGGLHVIICEHHDSSRVDRQFIGRTGRQGDPGSYEFMVSITDAVIAALDRKLVARLQPLALAWSWFGFMLLKLGQRRIEASHHLIRSRLARSDEDAERSLAFAGEGE